MSLFLAYCRSQPALIFTNSTRKPTDDPPTFATRSRANSLRHRPRSLRLSEDDVQDSIPHSKSLPVPPLAAPGVILEVESPQKVVIRIASRPPPASRPEEGEEMTQSAQCRGLRPTFPAYLRTLSMRIPSPSIRSGIRELLAQYPMAFLAHSLPLSTSPSSPTSRTVAERNCTLPKACLLDRLNARPSNVVSCLNWLSDSSPSTVSVSAPISSSPVPQAPSGRRPHEWNASPRAFSILQRRRRRRF